MRIYVEFQIPDQKCEKIKMFIGISSETGRSCLMKKLPELKNLMTMSFESLTSDGAETGWHSRPVEISC